MRVEVTGEGNALMTYFTSREIQMDIRDSFQNTTDGIFGFLPNLLGCLLLLLVGFIVAKVVSGIVGKVLQKRWALTSSCTRRTPASTSTRCSRAPAPRRASPAWSSG